MDCLRFTELASSAGISHEDASAYEEHRSRCAECTAAEAALNAVRDSVPSPAASTLAGFASRVRTRAAREQLARVFSPTRSALSAAALAISAAAIVVVSLPHVLATPQPAANVGHERIANQMDDEVDLLTTSEDPFASLSDDELRAVEQMMNESSDLDDETGT